MSRVYITIEQIFGLVLNLWAINGYKYSLKVGHTPVASLYMVSVLFTNIRTCLRGNIVSQYFNCIPPSLEEYLGAFNPSEDSI